MAEMTKVTGKDTHDRLWAKAWFKDGTTVLVSFGRTGERLSASIGVDEITFGRLGHSLKNSSWGGTLGEKMVTIRTAMKMSADAKELALNFKKVLI